MDTGSFRHVLVRSTLQENIVCGSWVLKVHRELDDGHDEVISVLFVGEPNQALHEIACVACTSEIIVPYVQLVSKVHIRVGFDSSVEKYFTGSRWELLRPSVTCASRLSAPARLCGWSSSGTAMRMGSAERPHKSHPSRS